MKTITRPAQDEFYEYYGGYIQRAVARGDVFTLLNNQLVEVRHELGSLTDEQALFRDAPKEWSIKEVVGHMNDGERVFSYRLLCISRNDSTPLPGFEQDDYVREAGFDNYPIQDLLSEFEHLRRANILAIQNMDDALLLRIGTASGYPFSVRALIHVLAGHVEHHMASLREKYLPAIS
jgi:hypothetical protein